MQDRQSRALADAFADLYEALPLVEADGPGIVEVDVQFESRRHPRLGVAEQFEGEARAPFVQRDGELVDIAAGR